MKPIYPFSEMQVGEVREITSPRKIQAVRSAAYMHAKKCERKGEACPGFKVTKEGQWFKSLDSLELVYAYRIERTA